jgi:hypothetical protein
MLAEAAGERVRPDNARALAGRLRRAATFLRMIGIEVMFGREGRARTRTIRITAAPALPGPEQAGAPPSAPSASSATIPKVNGSKDFAAGGGQ